MGKQEPPVVRALRRSDEPAVSRILQTSEYTHVRFDADELPSLLTGSPTAGVFSAPSGPLGRITGGSLLSFLLVNWLVPPSAWIGGFGVTWSASAAFEEHLDALLPEVERGAYARGARTLYYSGSDLDSDWLRGVFEQRGFTLVSVLRSYDKLDLAIPAQGNAQVRVRPFTAGDVAGVVAVEQEAFEPLWRHDANSFLAVARHYPYFVVAEDQRGILGYQFNIVDGGVGYLVRIAVHPRAAGEGIGTRLMAEAVRYFRASGAHKIVLNTEEQNARAQLLYERFGFERIQQRGFVLGRTIRISA